MEYDPRVKLTNIIKENIDLSKVDRNYIEASIHARKKINGDIKMLLRNITFFIVAMVILYLLAVVFGNTVKAIIEVITLIGILPIGISYIFIEYFKSTYKGADDYLIVPIANDMIYVFNVDIENKFIIEKKEIDLNENYIKIKKKHRLLYIVDEFASYSIAFNDDLVLNHNYFSNYILRDRVRSNLLYELYNK